MEWLGMFAGPEAVWAAAPVFPAVALLILLGTAAWDARTGIVPDAPLAVGAGIIGIGWFWLAGWHAGLWQIGWGAAVWGGIWLLNEVWYRLLGRDAVGMGDAKWSALAAFTFGPLPALAAWFVGAWVSLIYVGAARLCGRKLAEVYFAPFLFVGLMLCLWWRWARPFPALPF